MICISRVIAIKSKMIMKCAHCSNFTTEYLSFAYFHYCCHKYFKVLKYSVAWGRVVSDTFIYTITDRVQILSISSNHSK